MGVGDTMDAEITMEGEIYEKMGALIFE